MSRRAAPVVIAGAGATGSAAALMLRQEGFDGRVVLVGAEPGVPYERPPLSKGVLTDDAEPEPAAIHAAEAFDHARIELRLGERAQTVGDDGRVTLSSGTVLRASRVLMATGGTPRALVLPGAGLGGVLTLRDFRDALSLRRALREAEAVAVIGGGVLGAEVAASARALGRDVTVLEVGATMLERAVGPALGRLFTDAHRARGVRVVTGARIARLRGEGRRVRWVGLEDGTRVPADVVVVAVGIEPAAGPVAGLGLASPAGILTDARGATAVPGIYAAGDIARYPSVRAGGHQRLEHWRHAQAHGAAVARAMLGVGDGYDELPWFWSDQYDLRLQLAGDPQRADDVVVRGALDAEGLLAFYLRDGLLTGVAAVNRPRELRRMLRWLSAPARFDPRELAEPTVKVADLRPLDVEAAVL